jgi:hypothetical protein
LQSDPQLQPDPDIFYRKNRIKGYLENEFAEAKSTRDD